MVRIRSQEKKFVDTHTKAKPELTTLLIRNWQWFSLFCFGYFGVQKPILHESKTLYNFSVGNIAKHFSIYYVDQKWETCRFSSTRSWLMESDSFILSLNSALLSSDPRYSFKIGRCNSKERHAVPKCIVIFELFFG